MEKKILRPSYLDMVCHAVIALNEKSGSSVAAIVKFLEANYAGVQLTQVKTQLTKLVNDSFLAKEKRSFKLAPLAQKIIRCLTKDLGEKHARDFLPLGLSNADSQQIVATAVKLVYEKLKAIKQRKARKAYEALKTE